MISPRKLLAVSWCAGALTGSGGAATFYCDPVNGKAGNPGTSDKPWGMLEEVLRSGNIELRDASGKPLNPAAKVKGGDTILLESGWHGRIHVPAGYNEEFITLSAAPGAKADVSQVVIDGGRRWKVRGLRVSPSLAPQAPDKPIRHLVELGEHGADDSGELVIEDCFVFSVADASEWSAEDWVKMPSSGIWLGRHGHGHVARNNYILNTRMGVDLCAPGSICEGNVIDGFSGDGIRIARDSIVVRHNVIKNNQVGAKDGDDNHDDGIQCFLFNKGTGLVRDVTVEGNVIIQRETPGLPWVNPLQGIGFFDGPLVNFKVRNNIVEVDHWHGVSLYDAQGCEVMGNACWNPNPSSKLQPWIMLGSKQGLSKGNTVANNLACSFNFKADPQVRAKGNVKTVALKFQQRRKQVLDEIFHRYGPVHSPSGKTRVIDQTGKNR